MEQSAERGRLRWRCRRGLRELDLMLMGWLDGGFDRASAAQRAEFVRLLELPDPQLACYLLGGVRAEEPERAALIEAIRHPRS